MFIAACRLGPRHQPCPQLSEVGGLPIARCLQKSAHGARAFGPLFMTSAAR
jgi:hypothetical protein